MKIHIIGCSGSGKTYLANALSKKYNISHFDLDDIQWDNNAKEYGKKRTLDERKALLQEILYNNDERIIEAEPSVQRISTVLVPAESVFR